MLSEKEIKYITDTDFLLTKKQVLDKVWNCLEQIKIEIKNTIIENGFELPFHIKTNSGKISKGENYQNLPYMVLDYPAVLKKENIFAFRTMFWWGNFWSTTVHLQGESLVIFREIIIQMLPELITNQVFLCINQTPWEYHKKADNYKLIQLNDLDFLKKCDFIKLSLFFKVDDFKSMPQNVVRFILLFQNLFIHHNFSGINS